MMELILEAHFNKIGQCVAYDVNDMYTMTYYIEIIGDLV